MSDPYWMSVTALIPQLRGYAIALTRSSSEADDLVQEALSRAWRYRAGYTPDTNLKAWLYKILRNCFHTETASRRGTLQDVDGKLAAQLSCGPEQDWFMQYRDLLAAMTRISPSCREALLLVVASGLTYQEAAVVAGCAVGTVKSRVNRARAQLAHLLGAEPRPETAPRQTSTAPQR